MKRIYNILLKFFLESTCDQHILGPQVGNDTYYYYQCPTIIDESGDFFLPDIYINVDFGPLFTGLSGMVRSSSRIQLPLVIGLSNNIFDDYTHTVPVTMIPGVNIAASYILGIRQVYANGILAALGIFEVSMPLYYRAYIVLKVFPPLRPQILSFFPRSWRSIQTQPQLLSEVIYQV